MVRTRKLYKTNIKNKHGDRTNYHSVSRSPCDPRAVAEVRAWR